MKTILQLAALVILSTVAFGQSTVTTHNPDGTTTKTSASCDNSGNCDVWDSTNELGVRAGSKLLKAQRAYCKSQGISDKLVKGYDHDTWVGGKNINLECLAAWEKKQAGN